jgi:hypothetical protein
VEGGHGGGERKVGAVFGEGSGLGIAEHRSPVSDGTPVGPGEKRRKATAKALPPVEEAQPRPIILERGLKALAQGILE